MTMTAATARVRHEYDSNTHILYFIGICLVVAVSWFYFNDLFNSTVGQVRVAVSAATTSTKLLKQESFHFARVDVELQEGLGRVLSP